MDKSNKRRKQAKVTLPTAASSLKPVTYSVFSSCSGVNGPLVSSLFGEYVLGASFSEVCCCAGTSFCNDAVAVIMFGLLNVVSKKKSKLLVN